MKKRLSAFLLAVMLAFAAFPESNVFATEKEAFCVNIAVTGAYGGRMPMSVMIFTSEQGDTATDIEDSIFYVSETAEEGQKRETTVLEKVFQVFFVIIMSIGIFGLPAFYWLNSRKKRIMAEFDENKVYPEDDTDEDGNEDNAAEDSGDSNE